MPTLDTSTNDSFSDSDWLDIATTDDENDSIYSSRETDHDDQPRSRSSRSSFSCGSSPDGEVDAWEGLIDDTPDEGIPADVPPPDHHVPSPSQPSGNPDLDSVHDPEEVRINEGLDQSMVSTLSASRSSSLHASTVHNSSRDLRLSFPDPIHSSHTEPPYNEHNSQLTPPPTEPDAPHTDDEEMLSASQSLHTEPQAALAPPSVPELRVFLYGFPTIFKWSIARNILHSVAQGAGLSINADLDDLQGAIRQLTVFGPSERDPGFPRTITIFDRTLPPYDSADDQSLMRLSSNRPVAILLLPCHPLRLPEYVLQLPVLVSSYYSDALNIHIQDPLLRQQQMLDIPEHQLLRVTAPEESPIVNKESIPLLDSSRVYRAFSRSWSSDNTPKGAMTSTHTLTILAILSLLLGVIVRAAIPISLQHFTSPSLTGLNPNHSSPFWRMLRPTSYRERILPSITLDSSVVATPSSSRDLSLSVFCAESMSMTLSYAIPTNSRRIIPSSLSERSRLSQDLMVQPPHSMLPPDNRPKALSVIPESTSYQSDPVTTGNTVSALVHTSVSGVVKECATAAFSVVKQDLDMQDIFDALDALVQAISRQTQIILTQATTLMEQSARQWEKSVESLEQIKETLQARNERARRRAKEIREMGNKWFNDASEAVAASAELSKEIAWVMAENIAHRAQRARGRAREMAAEIQDFLVEGDRLEAFGASVWYTHAKHWEEWMKRARKQGQACKQSKRKLKSGIFCDDYF